MRPAAAKPGRAPPPEAGAIQDQAADDADDDVGVECAAEGSAAEHRSAIVAIGRHGARIDHALVDLAPEWSRSNLQQMLQAGRVRLDGALVRVASTKVRSGQRLAIDLEPVAPVHDAQPDASAMAPVRYEDDWLLVVDKPAGLVVHPGAGNPDGTLMNGLLAHHAGAAALPRAGIVHRLDKDTSGLMVVAKTLAAMTALVRAIAAREVDRRYLGLVHGHWPDGATEVDAPIGRHPTQRLKMAVTAKGREARTDFQVLELAGSLADPREQRFSALACRLHTGRTHQIRVHAARQGYPLVGDVLYGGRATFGLTRQALHAAHLAFEHPKDGRSMVFASGLPEDLAQAWGRAGVAVPVPPG